MKAIIYFKYTGWYTDDEELAYPIADAIRNKYGWKEVYDKDLIGDENGDCLIEILNLDNQKMQDTYNVFTGSTYDDFRDKAVPKC